MTPSDSMCWCPIGTRLMVRSSCLSNPLKFLYTWMSGAIRILLGGVTTDRHSGRHGVQALLMRAAGYL